MSNTKVDISVHEAIYGRSSVRSYTAEKLDRATINALLAAAVRAPTAMHEEPWLFAVIQDTRILKQLSDRAKQIVVDAARHSDSQHGRRVLSMVENPDFNIFYNASTLIAICARPVSNFVSADAWLAAQNLLLAAYGHGLGSCVIGFAADALNQSDIKAELGIPADVAVIAPLIIGKAAAATPASPRKAPDIIVWK